MILRATLDEAKKEIHKRVGIPTENILISATHSHSCPTSAGVFQSDPDPEYRAFLIDRIASSVDRAVSELAPAEVGVGKVSCSSEVFNRRWRMKPGSVPPDPFGRTNDVVQMNPPPESPNLLEPAGPIDPEIFVLAARSTNHQPRALLANYSLHYVGGIPGGHVSADYFGEFCRQISEKLGGEPKESVRAILTNGTSGNINNIDFRKSHPPAKPFEQVRHVAGVVADKSIEAYQAMTFATDVTLAASVKEIELGVRRPAPDEVETARKILEEAGRRPLRTLPEIYARETVLLAEYPQTVKLWIQALRVGPAAIVAIPCEVFAEIGLEIKEKSPVPATFVIELANGYNGYLPTPEQHKLGGYETWRARSSYLEADASRKIVAAALELLRDVADDE